MRVLRVLRVLRVSVFHLHTRFLFYEVDSATMRVLPYKYRNTLKVMFTLMPVGATLGAGAGAGSAGSANAGTRAGAGAGAGAGNRGAQTGANNRPQASAEAVQQQKQKQKQNSPDSKVGGKQFQMDAGQLASIQLSKKGSQKSKNKKEKKEKRKSVGKLQIGAPQNFVHLSTSPFGPQISGFYDQFTLMR